MRYSHSKRRLTTRRGLTILEVLIAIGVAIIGLFGAFALIPIAGQRVQRALLEDEKSALGRSAFHDFDARGMRDPNNWLWQQKAAQPNTFADVPSLTPGNTLGTRPPLPGISFCIDPFLIADRKDALAPTTVQYFPARPSAPSSGPDMLRVSLRNQLNVAPFAMNRQLARRIFESTDDIITSRPDDGTRPAQQAYSQLDPDDPTSTPYRRLADGHLSWMATVVPVASGGLPTDAYLLSIVVFHKRDLAADLIEQEAVFDVKLPSTVGFPGGGFGGGDIVLDSITTELNRDDWVVLTQPGPPDRFSWYRVVSVDVDTAETHVTLEGKDWLNPQIDTKCIAVRRVVAVYEKTIRLETSSTWKTN